MNKEGGKENRRLSLMKETQILEPVEEFGGILFLGETEKAADILSSQSDQG